MRTAALAIAMVAACGGDTPVQVDGPLPVDAGDRPPDPFAGMYDSPDDFPRTNCRAGALAGFARTEVWYGLSLRTELEGDELVTYVPETREEDVRIPHLLTDDDLLVRWPGFDGSGWWTRVFDACDVLPDGTLIGHEVYCSEAGGDPRCWPPQPFVEPPHRWIAGESEGDGLSLLGEIPLEGRPPNVRVADGIAYLPMLDRGMRIVSVVNPAAPVKRGWWIPAEPQYYNDVKLLDVGGRRYAVLAGYPVDVVDVTDPASPQLVSQMPYGAHTLFIEGTLVYLDGGGARDLTIVDLAIPSAPRLRAIYDDPDVFETHDLHVAGGIAYLNAPDRGLVLVDCRNPDAPVALGLAADPEDTSFFRYWHSSWLTQIGGRTLVVQGDEGRDGRLVIFDVDPASPAYLTVVGRWFPRAEISLHNVMARGSRAYFAHYQDGVRVLDLTDPAAPVQLAYFNTWQRASATAGFFHSAMGIDLDPATRRIYVADAQRGLLVLEGTAAVFP